MNRNFFTAPLESRDEYIASALTDEKVRQQNQIELIASENTVSRAVLDALGSVITNKTVEGYPGHRFHGGAEFADIIENAAIERAKELFGCKYVNAQPHSGSQANQAVLFALLEPHDAILSLDLSAGGHLSHGAKGACLLEGDCQSRGQERILGRMAKGDRGGNSQYPYPPRPARWLYLTEATGV